MISNTSRIIESAQPVGKQHNKVDTPNLDPD